ASSALQPSEHGLGVLVRREDRIEDLHDPTFLRDQREALDQTDALEGEGREAQRVGEPELPVAEDLVRQVRPADQLALVLRILAADAEDRRPQPPELGVQVTVRAGVRSSAA